MKRNRLTIGLQSGRKRCEVWLPSLCNALLVAVLGLAAMLAVKDAAAQAIYGSIFGTVSDTTGAAVPNATVTVTDISKGTSVKVQSNSTGDYRVDHLIPDTYSVKVEMQGFDTSSVGSVVVYADTAPKVDVHLTVGSASTSIQVSGGAPLLQTDRADVSTVLNARAIQDLPNLDRNFTGFELLTPGTSYIGWSVGQATNPQQSEQIEVNGQLPFATGYQLDGTDDQDPIQGVAVINPNLDAVSEMKVTSQNYDAELGNAVAGIVTAQTKSGSNALHGTAFEYRRSDAQQARDPFTQFAPDSLTGKYIPSFLHNQFGGSVGGPVKKDKLFFFGDYQGLREKTGTTILTTVPTALAKSSCTSGGACNLSDYLNAGSIYQVYDPTTGDPNSGASRTAFTGNVIPSARLSAPAVALLKDIPAPNNGTGITDNYLGSGSGGFNTDQFDVRVDDQINSRFHAFGRYTRFNSDLTGAAIFGAAGGVGFGLGDFAGSDTALDQSVAAGGDIALSEKWLTDFRFGWFRLNIDEEGPDYNQPLGTNLGIPNVNQGDLSLTGGLPQFQIAVPANGSNGSASVTYGTSANVYLQTESQFQGVNNWTRIQGNHAIKFGADVRYALNHLVGVNNNNLLSGAFQFQNTVTASTGSQGLGYASFLLGDVSTFSQTDIQNTNASERQKRDFVYAQDTWRLTQKVTLDYGLRWELYWPETVNGKGNGGLLNLNTGNVQIAGYGPYGTNMNVQMDYAHLAPRLGIAWQALPNTVVRAGYGRTYGMGWSGDIFGEVLTFSYPTAVVQNDVSSSSYVPTFSLNAVPSVNPFPAIPSSGNYALPNGIQLPTRPLIERVPTLDSWNLQLQQEISSSASLQVGYVGSHGIHNMFDSSNQANPNQQTLAGFDCSAAGPSCNVPIDPDTKLPYTVFERDPYYDGTAQRDLGVNFGVPHMWTQSFRYNANEATTRYDALQVVFQKRFTQGYQIMANYTWSSARANESDYFFIDHRADYGNSYYNRRNAFIFSGNWDLPFGHEHYLGGHAPGWVNEFIGGYSLNGVVTADSGLPFTPSYSLCGEDEDIDGQGGTLCRPSKSSSNPSIGIHKGSFNPSTHEVQYFPEVATLATPGQVSGPFVRPQAGTFGNIERDSYFGPGLLNTDLTLAKRFALTERLNAQFTAQAFNVFNHANLAGPSGCVDCGGTAGYITDVVAAQLGSSMRGLQFAARLQF